MPIFSPGLLQVAAKSNVSIPDLFQMTQDHPLFSHCLNWHWFRLRFQSWLEFITGVGGAYSGQLLTFCGWKTYSEAKSYCLV